MGKWMAAVVVLVSACGVGVPEQKDSAVLINTPQHLKQRRLPTTVTSVPRAPRETVRVGVDLKMAPGHEGQRLSVLVGMLGCGISVDAVGSGVVHGGVAHVKLKGPIAADSERMVIVTLDDGDGFCTENDQMWSAQLLTGQADLDAVFDLDELEAGPSWMCMGASED